MKRLHEFELQTPLLFLVFNRLDTTKKVFEEIRKAKPKQLFIASDGPRKTKEDEEKVVEQIRKYVLSNIDWKCNVKTLFRKNNLGCKYAVSSAIDWFFENVEQGIILEDDCLPSQSFFRFCRELLEKYKDDERIMQISGTNVEGKTAIKESYFFTPCFNAWGWATWRRAWKKYDVEMKDWKIFRFSIDFFNIVRNYSLIEKLKSWRLYQLTYSKKINTWDYQWIFMCLRNKGLCIIPQKNMITNLGFKIGTHTTNYRKTEKTLKKFETSFKLNTSPILNRRGYIKIYLKFFK